MTAGVLDVQGRIATIQARFATVRPAAVATGAVPFSAALARADGAATVPAPATGQTGTGGADRLIAAARRYLGVEYLWGGTDPTKGLDCSGFVQRAFRDVGIELPRVSRDQAKAGTPVASLADARPGDLVAFDYSSSRPGIDHIGIYVGDGKMLHTNRPGAGGVRVEDIKGTPAAIRRVLPEGGVPAATAGPGDVPFADLFAAAGARHGVSPAILAAVARAESAFNPRAVSHAGAQGLMQLMPGTARDLGVADPFDPPQAVDGAARLLAGHLERFGSVELALAAYNAGPGAVQRHGGVPPYRETQAYVAKIMQELS